ncbi:MAG TPA: hypothetical protein DCO79_07080 [Spirochaeta sp.]|nr:hypothetical protein [Spirochaeta sp.]
MEECKENRTYILNTTGISTVEFFWGLGLPLVLESTFLQLFLAELGASNMTIGLVPTFFFIGQACLGIVAAYQTRKLEKQRAAVIVFHLIPSVTICLFGIYLFLIGTFMPSTIMVFFIVYILFNAGIGITLPVWQNYVVKLFNSKQVIPAFAIMMISQSVGRLLSSFFIAGFFTDREITASSSASLFILCGLLFFIGSFGFMLTHEPDLKNEHSHAESGFFSFIAGSFRNIFKNKNLLLFLLSDIEMYAVIAAISFYANYAVNYHGISAAAAAGVFVGLNYTGQITANIIFGTFNFLMMRNKCTFGRICSIGGIILLITASGLLSFLLASVLFGISRAIRSLIYAPAIRQLTGKNDITSYYATAAILLLPLSTGIPLVCGKMLDSLPVGGPDGYRIVFGLLGLLSFISIFFIRSVNFRGTTAET